MQNLEQKLEEEFPSNKKQCKAQILKTEPTPVVGNKSDGNQLLNNTVVSKIEDTKITEEHLLEEEK